MALTFTPLLPHPLLWTLFTLAAVIAGLWIHARGASALWRVLALALLCLALTNPSLVRENRQPTKSVVAVVTDRSGSQNLGNRARMTDAARDAIAKTLAENPAIEPRFVDVGDGTNDGGTQLFSALNATLSDVPKARVAGAIVITDGVVHDIPNGADTLALSGPLHMLVTGHPDERDRQVRFVTTPKFGIVGKPLDIRAIAEERGGNGQAEVVLRVNGREIKKLTVATGTPFTLQVPVEHGGGNMVELEVAPLANELTTLNNRAVLVVEGVRDRLRVLLVSGQPHPGERAWRNLLKSDPNVDLVHFSILRAADKSDGTPLSELSLIVFPIHDLFVNRLKDFDLVIFDRYANQGYIPAPYLNNIARYLSEGGAVLMAMGPEFVSQATLANSQLGNLMPAQPNGQIIEQRFRPGLTEAGKRHPVTRDLSGAGSAPWGEWFRLIGAKAPTDRTLMSGPGDNPLLVLNGVDKGRIAMLMSDQIWLWARGYGSGGPYLDFQRRLVHWLMKEPSLEQEALRATAQGDTIRITRQSMKDAPGPVTLQMPDGTMQEITLKPEQPGLFTATVVSRQPGLHMLKADDLTSFVSIGPANPREFLDVFSSTEHLRKIAEATGGSVRRIGDNAGGLALPRIDTGVPGPAFAGSRWIGFPITQGATLISVSQYPATIGFWALLVLAGMALMAWVVEGRRR